MKIDQSGQGLSPWRQRVLPLLLRCIRAAVGYLLLRTPIDLLLHDPLFLAGLAPRWTQYLLAGVMGLGVVLFVASRTVLSGALLMALTLIVFEFLWRHTGQLPHGTTLAASLAIVALLTAGEWSARHLQRRIYGSSTR